MQHIGHCRMMLEQVAIIPQRIHLIVLCIVANYHVSIETNSEELVSFVNKTENIIGIKRRVCFLSIEHIDAKLPRNRLVVLSVDTSLRLHSPKLSILHRLDHSACDQNTSFSVFALLLNNLFLLFLVITIHRFLQRRFVIRFIDAYLLQFEWQFIATQHRIWCTMRVLASTASGITRILRHPTDCILHRSVHTLSKLGENTADIDQQANDGIGGTPT
mmetsp:Transcript_2096/g.3381  ORF Transcript_2096/g.3381 Transcript_2096/m.3381 type:complete len:217 (-) Transcript_2096:1294-1944(-)